jgi:XTP/dITP diphosphohydrolase
MQLVFCTNNLHKLNEVSHILGDQIQFLTLKEIGFEKEIPEPYETLEENSLIKAKTVFDEKKVDCFAEDTGLFIDSLNGEPGVFSARYAGEHANADDNIQKVMTKLGDSNNRNAFFKTVITLMLNEEVFQFSGECRGRITKELSGEEGFGYDPIFVADGYEKTFAALTSEEKNAISHRKKAFDKLITFLKNRT